MHLLKKNHCETILCCFKLCCTGIHIQCHDSKTWNSHTIFKYQIYNACNCSVFCYLIFYLQMIIPPLKKTKTKLAFFLNLCENLQQCCFFFWKTHHNYILSFYDYINHPHQSPPPVHTSLIPKHLTPAPKINAPYPQSVPEPGRPSWLTSWAPSRHSPVPGGGWCSL